MADTTRDILYRGFLLNEAAIQDSIGSDENGTIAGCTVDTWDDSDVDVVQFREKRSLQDGMDAGDVFLGARRVRVQGTLYEKSRGGLFDAYLALRAALNPVLAQRESPLDKGYRPLQFYAPTLNTDATVVANSGGQTLGYPDGSIPLQYLAIPYAKQLVWQDDAQGGEDVDALAIPWAATFMMKDPTLYAQVAQDYLLSGTGTKTGNLVNRGTYHAPLNILFEVGSAAGTITVAAGSSTFIITVPASSGNRIIRYKGYDKLLSVEENSIELVRFDLLPGVASMTHPLVPAGVSPYTITYSGGITATSNSHMWFSEAFA